MAGSMKQRLARILEVKDGVAKIMLNEGSIALIDEEDLPRVIIRQWHKSNAPRNSYAVASFDKKKVRMHRYIMNAPKGLLVDHINGNGLDNRKCNLRLCTNSENQRNGRGKKNTASPYKGAYFFAGRKKCWSSSVQITKDGVRTIIRLGYFMTDVEAAMAYDKAALKYYGEFAKLNFPALSAIGGSEAV